MARRGGRCRSALDNLKSSLVGLGIWSRIPKPAEPQRSALGFAKRGPLENFSQPIRNKKSNWSPELRAIDFTVQPPVTIVQTDVVGEEFYGVCQEPRSARHCLPSNLPSAFHPRTF